MFHLVKHYYDLIDEKGNAFIIYDAKLGLFGLTIPYSSIIFNDQFGKTHEKSCLSALKIAGSAFSQSKLGLAGQCHALQSFDNLPLIERHQKRLDWHCHSPKTQMSLTLNQQSFQGLGYAETLNLAFFPWRLPIDELYWGRFVSENHSLVWIEWRGKKPLKRLIYNQSLSERFELNDEQLRTADWTLHFENPVLIKNSLLISVIKSVPLLRFIVNKRFAQSQEIKWKSRARLDTPNGTEQGWALYEKVIWKSEL